MSAIVHSNADVIDQRTAQSCKPENTLARSYREWVPYDTRVAALRESERCSKGGSKHDRQSGYLNSNNGYYDYEQAAVMAATFISSLFACRELHPPTTNLTSPGQPVPKLAIFIAYVLYRTRLASCVTFASLFLLQQLKNRFAVARSSLGHQLFISAFMTTSKVVGNDLLQLVLDVDSFRILEV